MYLLKFICCVILFAAPTVYAEDKINNKISDGQNIFLRMEKDYIRIHKIQKRDITSRPSVYEQVEKFYINGTIPRKLHESIKEGLCVNKNSTHKSTIKISSILNKEGKKRLLVTFKEVQTRNYSPLRKYVPPDLPLNIFMKEIFKNALYFSDSSREVGYALRSHGSKIIIKKVCTKYNGCSETITYGNTLEYCYYR